MEKNMKCLVRKVGKDNGINLNLFVRREEKTKGKLSATTVERIRKLTKVVKGVEKETEEKI